MPFSANAIRPLSLEDVRTAARIPSGYQTDRVFRLVKECRGSAGAWSLCEQGLDQPYRKTYDSGDVDEWLASYGPGDDTRNFVFVATPASGMADGLLTYSPVQWNHTLWLVDIRVRRERRRRGIGSSLLCHLKDQARQEGRRGISVETQISNYPAVSFYSRHGFEVAGFHDHWYSNDDLANQDVALFLFWEAT